MSRSSKKGPYIDQKLLKKVVALKNADRKEPIKTWARASQIPPEFVGFTFQVHNGRYFIDVLQAMDSETVELGFIDNSSPCLIRGEEDKGFLGLVMPMRI